MNATEIVVGLIALSGGTLVGRTRLQKEAYLLDRCGGNLGVSFTYHHYGPYSFDLKEGWTDAFARGQIEITERPGQHHGIPYAIFELTGRAEAPPRLGELDRERISGLLSSMNGVSDIVLELAATIAFLRDQGGYPNDAVAETRMRKPLKATTARIDKALSLLRDLGLEQTA